MATERIVIISADYHRAGADDQHRSRGAAPSAAFSGELTI
jgi:hypothetical protein